MRCFFHKWGKWEQYEVEIKFTPGLLAPKEIKGKMFKSTELRQRRHCKNCNFMEDRLIRD